MLVATGVNGELTVVNMSHIIVNGADCAVAHTVCNTEELRRLSIVHLGHPLAVNLTPQDGAYHLLIL